MSDTILAAIITSISSILVAIITLYFTLKFKSKYNHRNEVIGTSPIPQKKKYFELKYDDSSSEDNETTLEKKLENKTKKKTDNLKIYLFIIIKNTTFIILAIISGGLIWNVLNRLFEWSYFLGGSGNEPHGIHAFIWGAITVIPIVIFAFLVCYKFVKINIRTIINFFYFLLLYAFFGGIGAILFYDTGIRSSIEALNYSYGIQEIIIVFLWSSIISGTITLPFCLLHRIFKNTISGLYLITQVPLSFALSSFMVLLSLFIDRPIEELNQLRGLIAALGLRLGLFLGIILAIILNNVSVKQSIKSLQA